MSYTYMIQEVKGINATQWFFSNHFRHLFRRLNLFLKSDGRSVALWQTISATRRDSDFKVPRFKEVTRITWKIAQNVDDILIKKIFATIEPNAPGCRSPALRTISCTAKKHRAGELQD